jgi:hypothetical protein
MSPGLHWIRHRQRRFARALLPLFGLVWLQLAAMPCIGAHQPAVEGAAEAAVIDHAGDHHGVAHSPAHVPADDAHIGHCPYCPPSGGAGTGEHCDEGGQCAYPHEPGVDARFASMAALPTSMAPPLEGLLEVPCSLAAAQADRADPLPHRSVSLSYCRFIE